MSAPVFETLDVTIDPTFGRKRRPDTSHPSLVSATVYLRSDQLELIKQICADRNRRISDLISDAVDDYLRKRR